MNTVRNERGVVLVFVAMGLLIFLLFLGLALDTGWLVYVTSPKPSANRLRGIGGSSGAD